MTALAGSPNLVRERLSVFLVAGEHSGDHLGAGLMRALRERVPGVHFTGVGGEGMTREGLRPIFPMSDIAVMGFVPVLRRLPRIIQRINDTAAAVLHIRPDVLVIIDSPDFTHRVARRVRRHAPSIPIVDYVSPSVWAWRPGRAGAMRAYVDHVLALLPFEPDAHQRLGGPPCTYVGHPLVERLNEFQPDAEERACRETPSLLVLPGSRRSEIRRLSEAFGETVSRLVAELGPIEVVLPTVPDRLKEVEELVARWAVVPRIVSREADKLAAFRRARAALAASGTVTLELALSGVPMVVGYKVSPYEVWLKYVVKVHSIVLPNLVLGHNAIPEFIQDECTPEKLVGALRPLLVGGPQRDAQLVALAEVAASIRAEQVSSPSEQAAGVILSAVSARTA